jgi:hypothetical protein
MGIKYLHVNTKHLPSTHTSKYTVNLQEPLKNVTHVEVISFSTQNDFHNISEGNNSINFLFRGPSVDPSLNDVHAIYDMSFTIEPAFYTHDELIDAIKTSMMESIYADLSATGDGSSGIVLAPNLTIGAYPVAAVEKRILIDISNIDGKTKIVMGYPPSSEPSSTKIDFGVMSYEFRNRDEFENSIYHRLGFKKKQIFFSAYANGTPEGGDLPYTQNDQLFQQVDEDGAPLVATNVKFNVDGDLALHGHTHVGTHVSFDEDDGSAIYLKTYIPAYRKLTSAEKHATPHLSLVGLFNKVFILQSTTNVRFTKVSSRLAWETHEAVHITCDIVNDYETTSHNYARVGRTELTNELVRIPVEVNRASWIHYFSRESEMVHTVQQAYIQKISLGMRSTHSRREFASDAYNSFAISLKFTTKDDDTEPSIRQYESVERGQFRTQYERV